MVSLLLFSDAASGEFVSGAITKLLQNFRSHPDLLTLPSKLFYDSELQPMADPFVINSLIGWNKLPNKKLPLVRKRTPLEKL